MLSEENGGKKIVSDGFFVSAPCAEPPKRNSQNNSLFYLSENQQPWILW
jgi:hypothetical protein